jgi:hypothetical protein
MLGRLCQNRKCKKYGLNMTYHDEQDLNQQSSGIHQIEFKKSNTKSIDANEALQEESWS